MALPVHVLVRILKHLGTDKGYKEAAVTRLVSKDWMQAFSESPGHLCRHKSQEWSDDSDIGKFCALAPSMSSVKISSKQDPLILQPLAACTQLKEVTISGLGIVEGKDVSISNTIHVDFNGLPGSVQLLDLTFMAPFVLSGLQTFQCASIKKLFIHCKSEGAAREASRLLRCLPGLQRLKMWIMEGDERRWFPRIAVDRQIEARILRSLMALSSLALFCCKFAIPQAQLAALRGLFLACIVWDGEELISALQLLPGLSNLGLKTCNVFRPRHLTPVSSLRTLSIKGSTRALIAFAPDSLQSLECDWDVTEPLPALYQEEIQEPPVARLGSLTRLKLSCGNNGRGLKPFRADYLPINAALLQGLPLRELALINCSMSNHTQLSTLYVEGALCGLEKIHIEDGDTEDADFLSETMHPTDRAQALTEEQEARLQRIRTQTVPYYLEVLRTVGNGIIHLPQLQQVSGYSAVWYFGVDDVLKGWSMKRGADESLRGLELLETHVPPWLKVWCKP